MLLSLQCYCPDCDVVNDFVSTNYGELRCRLICNGDILEHSSSVQEVHKFYCDIWHPMNLDVFHVHMEHYPVVVSHSMNPVFP